jgi:hypothetical protein
MFFTNTFTVRRFTLSAQVDWRKGGDVTNLTQNIWDQFQRSRDYDDPSPCRGQTVANRCACATPAAWSRCSTRRAPRRSAPTASPLERRRDARVYVQDGSFVKLREVSLTYQVPQAFTRRLAGSRVGDVRLNVVGATSASGWTTGAWTPRSRTSATARAQRGGPRPVPAEPPVLLQRGRGVLSHGHLHHASRAE